MENRYDIAIIGGGIAGAAIGAAVGPAKSVVIFEAESHVGYHATGRSAAVFSCINGAPTTRALSRASLDFFTNPPEGFASNALLRRRGCLWICTAKDRKNLAEIAAHDAAHGRLESIDTRQARRLCPVLKAERVGDALFEAGGADIDVDLLHQGYLRLFRQAGGALTSGARIEAISRTSHGWTIEVNGERVRADIIVNAAGAWADQIAALAGAQAIGLTAYQRTAALTAPPQGMAIDDWPLVIDAKERFYFKPDAGLILFSPADESPRDPYDAQPDDFDIAVAVDRLEKATTLKVERLRGKWAGLRTFAPDRAPVVGFDPEIENFFWYAGQGGSGIQTSPALSAFAAAELLGEPPKTDLTQFGLSYDWIRRSRLKSLSCADADCAAG